MVNVVVKDVEELDGKTLRSTLIKIQSRFVNVNLRAITLAPYIRFAPYTCRYFMILQSE